MRYLMLRLGCAVRGHDWRQTTTPVGPMRRCRACYLEQAHSNAVTGREARTP